ncbi:glycosyltransferase [Pseudarthrobacter sp. B4EP4b]|uniref:glycosyltransferase n=1 Tax=Pseudarthrobacter sp. B4EP4b TaxID=2590664 RepID=UPI00115444E2|nr:glycosyltransferase [Pseudarthrobacter sp. B4EP4b]
MSGVIVHEWLEPHGGAEKVVQELASIFPTAPIKCLWNDAPNRFSPDRVSETWLAATPLRQKKSLALPLMPETWRHLGKSDAEWILCSSHLFAHHARFSGQARVAPKFVYAYTSARYIWNPEIDERGQSLAVRLVSPALQQLDRKRAREAAAIASISSFVQNRLENTWQRESQVIYPPVDVEAFDSTEISTFTAAEQSVLDALPKRFILGASRFIPYKRLDLVIQAGVAAGIEVVLAGSGPLRRELEQQSAEHPGLVTFVDSPSHVLLRELYRRCQVYVFPPVEDFGIMPVEAMATGTPVIASNIGGASETIIDGKTGVLLDSYDADSLRDAVVAAQRINSEDCRKRAWDFDKSVFREAMTDWIWS